ncbi:MAG: PDZ domain-containing protein [Gemmatimonadaceae bacterium]
MVLIDSWSPKVRRSLAAFALLTLCSGAAQAAPTIHQAQTRSRAPRQCSDCTEQEKMRRVREALLVRLDSLRWEIEHRRLTETERARAATEFAKTLMALESEAAAHVSETHRAVAVAVESARARGVRGYIGVTFDGLWARPPGSRDDNIIRFYEYPKIALVENSSPAERAGVVAGDTLVALNGDDVKQNEIAFGKILIPSKRITMRVRRDGSAKDLIVTVAEAPDYYVRRIERTPPAVAVAPGVPVPAGTPGTPGQVQVNSGTLRGTRPPTTFYWSGDALAGARLETVSDGLARALDVPEGVLVIRTVPGTATYDSGLREGDVVTHVGNTKVRSVTDLQRALTSGDDRERRLVIVREKKQRQITLRW